MELEYAERVDVDLYPSLRYELISFNIGRFCHHDSEFVAEFVEIVQSCTDCSETMIFILKFSKFLMWWWRIGLLEVFQHLARRLFDDRSLPDYRVYRALQPGYDKREGSFLLLCSLAKSIDSLLLYGTAWSTPLGVCILWSKDEIWINVSPDIEGTSKVF